MNESNYTWEELHEEWYGKAMIRIEVNLEEFESIMNWYLDERYPDIMARCKKPSRNNVYLTDTILDRLDANDDVITIDLEEL